MGMSSAAKSDCVTGIFDPDLTGALPADQTTYAAGSGTLPFSLSGATPNMTVSVQVDTQSYLDSRGSLSIYYFRDCFPLGDDPADGVYKGGAFNTAGSWTETPGTYYWQVQLFGNGSGYGCHMGEQPSSRAYGHCSPSPSPSTSTSTSTSTCPDASADISPRADSGASHVRLTTRNVSVWVRTAVLDELYEGNRRQRLQSLRERHCDAVHTWRLSCAVSWRARGVFWDGAVTVGSVNSTTGAFGYGMQVTRSRGSDVLGQHTTRYRFRAGTAA
jgi:hypothetical protein